MGKEIFLGPQHASIQTEHPMAGTSPIDHLIFALHELANR
jgi:hypothetical protein